MLQKHKTAWLSHCLASTLLLNMQVAVSADPSLSLVPVLHQQITKEQIVDGKVEAEQQSTVSAQTSAQVVEVYFDADQMVNKGDVLMRFKDTEQKANLAAVQAQVKEAQARVANADKEYQRIQQLQAKNAMSKADLDRALANVQAARARLAAARAKVKQVEEQLDYTVVKAPFSGIVIERHIEAGEMANPGQPLMTGFSIEQLRVVASVPQNMIEAVREHKKARLLLPAGRNVRSLDGEKITILPYSEQGHSFKVRVDLPPNIESLYPGMFIKVAFMMGMEKSLVVPQDAIAVRGEVRAVYVVQDADAEEPVFSMRQVRLGQPFNNGMVEVLSGVNPGEQIAYDPIRASILLKQQRAKRSSVAAPTQAH